MQIGNIYAYNTIQYNNPINANRRINNKTDVCSFGDNKVNVISVDPKVHLISSTSNIVDTLYVACKNCTAFDSPYDIYCNLDGVPKEEKIRVIRNTCMF